MSNDLYMEGVLDVTGVATVNVGGRPAPFTATLKSAAGGRKIEAATAPVAVATDLYQPTYDVNTATVLAVAFLAPVLLVKFTGAQGDPWSVR